MRRVVCGLFLSVACLLLFTGCEWRELCYDHSHKVTVNLYFDWSEAPEADPSTMVVWAFPTDGSQGTRHELIAPTRAGFDSQIKLFPGSYRLVCFNGDTEENVEHGSVFDKFVITTCEQALLAPLSRQDNAPRPAMTENEPVRSSSAHLYTHTHPQTLELSVADATSHKSYSVTFVPRRATSIWNVRVVDVENYNPGVDASAIVTGAAEAWSPMIEGPCGLEVTVPFQLDFDGVSTLTGKVVIFGDNAPHDVSHNLRIYTSLKYYFDFDVTDQVHSAPDPKNVDIIVKGLKLPAPQNESGLLPGVDNWGETEHIDIPM